MSAPPDAPPRRRATLGLLVAGLAIAFWFGLRSAPRELPVTLRLEGDRDSTAQIRVQFEAGGEALGGASWTFSAKAPPSLVTHPKLPRARVTARVEARSRDSEVTLNDLDLDATTDTPVLRILLDFSRRKQNPPSIASH